MNLDALAQAVTEASSRARRPPDPEEILPLLPTIAHLDDPDLIVLWKVVRAVRERSSKLRAGLPEERLAALIVDALEQDPELKFEALTQTLLWDTEAEGPWLIETWLMHAEMDEPWIPLSDGVGLLRAIPSRDHELNDEEVDARFDAFRWLGAAVIPPLQRLDLTAGSVNTFRNAVLCTRETGVIELARPRARARAQYAVAAWVVLAPNDQFQLLPEVGGWTPQPNLLIPQRAHDLSLEQTWTNARPRAGALRGYSPYHLPDQETLRRPFEAMERLERNSAQAVLTAGLQHLAGVRASRLQPSERIRALLAGMEALGHRGNTNGLASFRKLVGNLSLWDVGEARGWNQQRLNAAISRLKDARNIATHGRDAALLDLGYPVGTKRQMRHNLVEGYDVASATLFDDLGVCSHLLGRAIATVYSMQVENGWDDLAFDRVRS